MTTKIAFQLYCVTNGTTKARVHYNLDNRIDGRKCVTLYAKNYGHDLGSLFAETGATYRNDTDYNTDYFDKGKIVLFEDHPLYAAARATAERFYAKKGY